MPVQTGNASDHFDLLDKLRTFLTTLSPVGQRWTQRRWTGWWQTVQSSFLAPFEPFRAFGQTDPSGWRTAVGQPTPSHVGIRFVQPFAPDVLAITAMPVGSFVSTEAPRDFTLEYSSDGSSWTPLTGWTNQIGWNSGQRREFPLGGAPLATYWRVRVSVNNGSLQHTSIGEIELLKTYGFAVQLNEAVPAQVILEGPGVSETDQIFIGLQMYERPPSDIYNWRIQGQTGFVQTNTFAAQPGVNVPANGFPLWNSTIQYWFVGNGSRVIVVAKVEATYQVLYLGKMLPYATPQQWPYPLVVAGMLPTDSETRFSDSGITFPFKGSRGNLLMRNTQGVYMQPQTYPWLTSLSELPGSVGPASLIRDTEAAFGMIPVILTDTDNVYGELDGVFYVSGFANSAEDIVEVGATDYLVVPDTYRNGIGDFIAVRLT